jgi:lipoprotein-anchoring transpeptidase ErfK/SrfK
VVVMRVRSVLALAAVGAAIAAGAGAGTAGAADATAAAGVPSAPTPSRSWTGRVLVKVVARAAPRPDARRKAVLQPIAPIGAGPTVLAITRSIERGGVRWVEVLLPIRPNGSRGWIPADVLRLRAITSRIVIDTGDRRLSVFRAGHRVMRVPVAVGTPSTPTPLGKAFAIAERIPIATPGAFLGPLVFPITGYSEKLNEFAGGNGRVAIHGTSLPQLIGSRVSHGCIRMRNADILRMAAIVGPGTPVAITP